MDLLPSSGPSNIQDNAFGGMYNTSQTYGGARGVDTYGQHQTVGMLNNIAAGQGPNPAVNQLQHTTQQAQALGQAQAASARGQFGMANAQHNANQLSAGLGQQFGAQSNFLNQQQQMQGMLAAPSAEAAQRGQDLQAAGMNAGMAQSAANIALQQQLANQQQSANGLSGAVGMGMGLAAMAL